MTDQITVAAKREMAGRLTSTQHIIVDGEPLCGNHHVSKAVENDRYAEQTTQYPLNHNTCGTCGKIYAKSGSNHEMFDHLLSFDTGEWVRVTTSEGVRTGRVSHEAYAESFPTRFLSVVVSDEPRARWLAQFQDEFKIRVREGGTAIIYNEDIDIVSIESIDPPEDNIDDCTQATIDDIGRIAPEVENVKALTEDIHDFWVRTTPAVDDERMWCLLDRLYKSGYDIRYVYEGWTDDQSTIGVEAQELVVPSEVSDSSEGSEDSESSELSDNSDSLESSESGNAQLIADGGTRTPTHRIYVRGEPSGDLHEYDAVSIEQIELEENGAFWVEWESAEGLQINATVEKIERLNPAPKIMTDGGMPPDEGDFIGGKPDENNEAPGPIKIQWKASIKQSLIEQLEAERSDGDPSASIALAALSRQQTNIVIHDEAEAQRMMQALNHACSYVTMLPQRLESFRRVRKELVDAMDQRGWLDCDSSVATPQADCDHAIINTDYLRLADGKHEIEVCVVCDRIVADNGTVPRHGPPGTI